MKYIDRIRGRIKIALVRNYRFFIRWKQVRPCEEGVLDVMEDHLQSFLKMGGDWFFVLVFGFLHFLGQIAFSLAGGCRFVPVDAQHFCNKILVDCKSNQDPNFG